MLIVKKMQKSVSLKFKVEKVFFDLLALKYLLKYVRLIQSRLFLLATLPMKFRRSHIPSINEVIIYEGGQIFDLINKGHEKITFLKIFFFVLFSELSKVC